MNPVIHFFIIVVLGIEITFSHSIPVNIAIAIISAILFLLQRPTRKEMVALFLTPVIPAFGSLIAQAIFGDYAQGQILFTRIYAYVWMGGEYVMSANARLTVLTLEQRLHLPTKVVYGVYGALNLLPQTQRAIQEIRWAGFMRGVRLSFWSPSLYFKAILKALQWSEELVKAMTSHAFVEDAPRSHFETITIPFYQYLIAIVIVLIVPISHLYL